MTQITQNDALLASNGRRTYGDGASLGQVYDDDTGKLVSHCGRTPMAYSGVGMMKRRAPTHEWIA